MKYRVFMKCGIYTIINFLMLIPQFKVALGWICLSEIDSDNFLHQLCNSLAVRPLKQVTSCFWASFPQLQMKWSRLNKGSFHLYDSMVEWLHLGMVRGSRAGSEDLRQGRRPCGRGGAGWGDSGQGGGLWGKAVDCEGKAGLAETETKDSSEL